MLIRGADPASAVVGTQGSRGARHDPTGRCGRSPRWAGSDRARHLLTTIEIHSTAPPPFSIIEARLVCRGGYPEAHTLPDRIRRRWFERYLETVLRREVTSAADLRRFDSLLEMSRLLLSTTGAELVTSRLATQLGIDRATAETYEPWIETAFLVHRVAPWRRKVASKIIRRPKLHATDTGLAAAIMGKDQRALARPTEPATGPLVESFALTEIAKQLTWADTPARLHHLRDRDGLEVDAIIEATDGRVVAIEVKATTTPRPAHAGPMRRLRDTLDRVGSDFIVGVVLHTGDQRVPLDDRLVALPIADLWT